jgi:hypothetical protein
MNSNKSFVREITRRSARNLPKYFWSPREFWQESCQLKLSTAQKLLNSCHILGVMNNQVPTPGPDGASSKKNKDGGDLFRLSHRIIFWWAKCYLTFEKNLLSLRCLCFNRKTSCPIDIICSSDLNFIKPRLCGSTPYTSCPPLDKNGF